MGSWFDARETPGGWRFRRWSSIVDAYTTEPLTEDEAHAEMMLERTGLEVQSGIAKRHTDERIARAKVNGTTVLDKAYWQDIHAPWEKQRHEWEKDGP